MARLNHPVFQLEGIVKHAYPLVEIPEECIHEQPPSTFGPGYGPGASVASLVVAIQMETSSASENVLIFLYDIWASKAQHFQRHYKIQLKGHGLMLLPWLADEDSQEPQSCVVVAERSLLRKIHEFWKTRERTLSLPRGSSVELSYQEPLRVKGSDQLRYLPETIIRAHELGATSCCTSSDNTKNTWDRGKRTLRDADINDTYVYTNLSDLSSGLANVFGVVVNMVLPRKSAGKDIHMHVHITDESCPKRQDALLVLVFYRTLEQMPRVLYVGDVIRFHRLKIQQYDGRLQGVCYHATRFLVSRVNSEGNVQQSTSSEHWTYSLSDEVRIRQLVEWAKSSFRDDTSLPPNCTSPPTPLDQISCFQSFVDVVVRVLHVEMPTDNQPCAVLLVHDGTGHSACTDDAIIEQLIASKIDIPGNGMIMRLQIDSRWETLTLFGFTKELCRYWSRFRNLAITASNAGEPFFELHFREASSLLLVPEFDPDVQLRVDAMQKATCDLDESDHITTRIPCRVTEHVPINSLYQVQQSTTIPKKYHCLVQVVGITPQEIVDIAKPSASDCGDFVYMFVLHLQDESGSLDAIVYGRDAECFLPGLPPCDLKVNTMSRQIITKYVRTLTRSLKKIHCCIKSYHPEDTQTVRFRMFDTVLYKRKQSQ